MYIYRNTIELNGVSSATIKGLLIQSLPPITKPLMRTTVEEIDGRDGDIITDLGFAAYDKQISIGLYGDFEIDDVIEYFNGQGTVTFSNEPDKYYYYQIINQIDFERLVRFRTATVTLHVQPFKFSTSEVEKSFDFVENLLSIPDYTNANNNVTVKVTGDTISFEGTATAATEFYVPISALTLNPGSYTLTATASGLGSTACSIRLIGSAPSNSDSFGGRYATLTDGTVTIQDTLETAKEYGYLWFYVNAGVDIYFTLTVSLQNNATPSVNIRNNGNYYSRPTMTISGSGTVNLSLNGQQLFVIYFNDNYPQITIDTTAMEAYQDTPDNLANRYVDGDYNNFRLNPGPNTITWTGNVSQLKINNYSRWI